MNTTGKEIKSIIPDVVADLNYTTGLMENLLHWVKNQMNSARVSPGVLSLPELTDDSVHIHQLQASTKKITISQETGEDLRVFADRDMVTLVLRNLISNAIKFTPDGGTILIRTEKLDGLGRVSIIDNGIGIDAETLSRIQGNSYYSTNGTASESGTGLGLMLCRDFLSKNSGTLSIESEAGRGSTFSFTLPLAKEHVIAVNG
jgi:signal transduction histidine kinase